MNVVPRKAIVSLSLLFFSFSAIAQKDTLLNQFNWLEGFWVNSDSTVVEQWWSEGDKLVGSANRVVDIKTYFDVNTKSEILEWLELKVKENKLVYVAITKEHNRVPMDFVFKPQEKNTFSFYNPNNDFPKWIIYKPIGSSKLLVTLKNDAKTRAFYYNKITP